MDFSCLADSSIFWLFKALQFSLLLRGSPPQITDKPIPTINIQASHRQI